MKVGFITPEARPFAGSGRLADAASALPHELRRQSHDCRVILPLYAAVPKELRERMRLVTDLSIPISRRKYDCRVFEAEFEGVAYYLLDAPYYFEREGLYGHYDDAERFALFSRAALEMLPYVGFQPDVLHANDWQSALVPLYYGLFYADQPFYRAMKTVFTIHHVRYQGQFATELLDTLGIPQEALPLTEWNGCINLMKGAIETAYAVTTVSPTYAEELCDPTCACGMETLFCTQAWKLSGILNGIDTAVYDPQSDPLLACRYSAEDVSGKARCKTALQREVGLPKRENVPLTAMTSRMASRKGFDIVCETLDRLLEENDMQLVLLGAGKVRYEEFFCRAQARYPEKFAYIRGFSPQLARRTYAGADVFLMPSQREPCGSEQMIACRYGAVPVVRATGGLKDSIRDAADGGNGFVFEEYDASELRRTLERALNAYLDRAAWQDIVKRAMRCDFGWKRTATAYSKLYRTLLDTK